MQNEINQTVEQIEPVQGMPVTRSPHYRLIYGNAFGFKLSPSDFCLTVANTASFPGTNINVAQEEVSIMMPLAQLKILSQHLAKIVESVEAEIGKIRIPARSKVSDEMITALLEVVRSADLQD